jgi:hypothetical protein
MLSAITKPAFQHAGLEERPPSSCISSCGSYAHGLGQQLRGTCPYQSHGYHPLQPPPLSATPSTGDADRREPAERLKEPSIGGGWCTRLRPTTTVGADDFEHFRVMSRLHKSRTSGDPVHTTFETDTVARQPDSPQSGTILGGYPPLLLPRELPLWLPISSR